MPQSFCNRTISEWFCLCSYNLPRCSAKSTWISPTWLRQFLACYDWDACKHGHHVGDTVHCIRPVACNKGRERALCWMMKPLNSMTPPTYRKATCKTGVQQISAL